MRLPNALLELRDLIDRDVVDEEPSTFPAKSFSNLLKFVVGGMRPSSPHTELCLSLKENSITII